MTYEQSHRGTGDNIGEIRFERPVKVNIGVNEPSRPHFPIPQPTQRFIGRDEDLSELHALLSENDIVFLNGVGGIGKTTVAMEYARRYGKEYNSLVWLDYHDSFRLSLLSLSPCFQFSEEPKEIIEIIISELSRYEGLNLLIIDNFSVESLKGEEKEREISFLQCQLPNFKKLITSREEKPGDFVKPKLLDNLPPDYAEALFREFFKGQYNPSILTQLFTLIEYHTLTIELIAKTLAGSHGAVTLGQLYSIFKEKKFDTPSGSVKTHLDYRNSELQINTYLGELFHLADLLETHLFLMKKFSVLPPSDIPNATLFDLLTSDGESSDISDSINTINDLVARGWLTQSEKGVTCHRIIRQYIQLHAKPAFENVQDLFLNITEKLSYRPEENPLERIPWIDFAVSLLEAFPEDREETAGLSSYVSIIYQA
ncbi:MAG: ATP-binding protein, partial [Candidatus Latescibacter sp.]|nr:ATP-binding protein [Candidatus Latescibacter sp.]